MQSTTLQHHGKRIAVHHPLRIPGEKKTQFPRTVKNSITIMMLSTV